MMLDAPATRLVRFDHDYDLQLSLSNYWVGKKVRKVFLINIYKWICKKKFIPTKNLVHIAYMFNKRLPLLRC